MKFWPFSRGLAVEKDVVAPNEEKAPTVFDRSSLFLDGPPLDFGQGDVSGAYSNSWIAYACIRRIALDGAGIPLLFLSDPDDPESSVPESNPTRQLFEHPSPYFSTNELMQWLLTFLNMRGEFFISFDDPMHPTVMRPHLDPQYWREILDGMELAGWRYQKGAESLLLTNTELVHNRFINPERPFRGLTPIQSAAIAFQTGQGADELSLNVIARGGEKSALYSSDKSLTRSQHRQATAELRARRVGVARVARDTLLPPGITPLDPKFLADDKEILELSEKQPDKIMSVFGVNRSILGFGTDEKYSNAQVRKRAFYEDTLAPMLKGVSDSFDRFFVDTLTSAYRCYVRFDWSAVPAMQDNTASRFEMAAKANTAGIPWTVLNDRFSLGLDVSQIPGADTIMISSTLAPKEALIEEWNNPAAPAPLPPAGAAEPGKAGGDSEPGLTNALIRKRAGNTRDAVQRGMRLLKQERIFSKQWRVLLQKHMNKAVKLANRIETADDVKSSLAPAFKGLSDGMTDISNPHHRKAALEGERSIVELVDGKMGDAQASIWRKAHRWSPGVADFLKDREKLIGGMSRTLFDDVIAAVTRTVVDGAEVSEIQHVIRTRFGSAPGGINRATTIARTEVGTAYNVARFSEIDQQGFEKHEWLTNGDELVRDNHVTAGGAGAIKVGDNFPGVEIPYPQAAGGDAEEVINCRCETIPVLKG